MILPPQLPECSHIRIFYQNHFLGSLEKKIFLHFPFTSSFYIFLLLCFCTKISVFACKPPPLGGWLSRFVKSTFLNDLSPAFRGYTLATGGSTSPLLYYCTSLLHTHLDLPVYLWNSVSSGLWEGLVTVMCENMGLVSGCVSCAPLWLWLSQPLFRHFWR